MDELILTNLYRAGRLRFALNKMRDDYERLAVILWLAGWRQWEIAEVYGVSRQSIQYICAEFRRRNGLRYLN